MNLNLGSVSASTLSLGYTGESTAYPYPAPYGTVDSNSLFNGQVLTENTTWRFVAEFAHLTIDHTAAQAETPPYGNDINDHSTAEEGYEGEDTATIEVRYSDGSTAQFTATVTVAQPATAPTEAPVIGTITTTDTTASIPFGAVTAATGYEYSADGTTWTDVTSPIELTDLTAETAYSGYHVRGKNSAGAGPASTFGFTTEAEPPAPDYTITVVSRSTYDTTPVVYGYLGDAINPSVLVNGVTYTPTVANGQWSVILPELALGSYSVTLSATDQGGTPLQDATGELQIIEFLSSLPGRRVGQRVCVTPSIRSSLGNSIH